MYSTAGIKEDGELIMNVQAREKVTYNLRAFASNMVRCLKRKIYCHETTLTPALSLFNEK